MSIIPLLVEATRELSERTDDATRDIMTTVDKLQAKVVALENKDDQLDKLETGRRKSKEMADRQLNDGESIQPLRANEVQELRDENRRLKQSQDAMEIRLVALERALLILSDA